MAWWGLGGLAGLAVVIGALAVYASRWRPPPSAPSIAEVNVVAGIPPLAYLAERVGDGHVDVGVLVRPGQDPHVFEPTPRDVMALSRARLLLKIGMPFEERLVERLAERQPGVTVVDATRGLKKRAMTDACCLEEQGDGDHDRGHAASDEHGCQSGAADPHVWLSPLNLKALAANVADALCEADAAHAGDYRKNEAALASELDALHARITRLLAPCRGRTFYVFHPAFGYFADAYGLKQESVEVGGRSPTVRQLQALIGKARADDVKVIFVQPGFDPRGAEAVAGAIGGAVTPMDSLAKDVPASLNDMAEKIAAAMGHGGESRQ